MKDLSNTKTTLRDALVQKGPAYVLKSLKELLPSDSPKQDLIAAIEIDLQSMKTSSLQGILSLDDKQLWAARVNKKVLDLLTNLEKDDFDKQARRSKLAEKQKIQKGHVLYQIPQEMQLEVECRCLVRIAFDEELILEDLKLDDDTQLKEGLRISDYMKVEIKDPSDSDDPAFDIRSTSEAIQFIDQDDFTEWRFYVKPLKSGEQRLELKVSIIQRIDGEDRIREKTLDESVVIIAEAPSSEETAWKEDTEDLLMPCAMQTISPKSSKLGGLKSVAMGLALLIGLNSVAYAFGPVAFRELGDWGITLIQNDEQAYDDFVKKYPETKRIEKALFKRAKAIQRDEIGQAERAKEALVQYMKDFGNNAVYKDQALWTIATLSQEPEDFINYTEASKEGENITEAETTVKELENKLWSSIEREPSAIQLDRYLRIYPDGSHRPTAIKLLADTINWTKCIPITPRLADDTIGWQDRMLVYAAESSDSLMRQQLELQAQVSSICMSINNDQIEKGENQEDTIESSASDETENTEPTLDCSDRDHDGICDDKDNCPDKPNANQRNDDADALGNACDKCPDKKGELVHEGCPAPKPTIVVPDMVFVKGGDFQIGSNNDNPMQRVTMSGFYIGKYEVTQKQWRDVMKSDPETLFNKGCDNCPVERVSWKDIRGFLTQLNKQTGKNYRLPTEAEWEYAAKGGQQSRAYKYSGSNSVGDVASYIENYKTNNASGEQKTTRPVGTKKPNELGLYDMSGNVWEWCEDDWHNSYDGISKNGSAWLSSPRGSFRVIRGGSWGNKEEGCQVVYRNRLDLKDRAGNLGFRLARSL